MPSGGRLCNVLLWPQDAGRTPLYVVCESGQSAIVDLLVAFGQLKLRLNVETRTGFTPLHAAAANNHVTVVSTLCEIGVDVNIPNVRRVCGTMCSLKRTGC